MLPWNPIKKVFPLFLLLELSQCTTTPPVPEPSASPLEVLSSSPWRVKGKRWRSRVYLSPDAISVLTTAFDTDFPEDAPRINAYQFPIFGGQREMDPWNFPSDFPDSAGSEGQGFSLSYGDHYALLRGVEVREEISSMVWIPYSQMLEKMTVMLNAPMINASAQGGRLLRIIYCLRNFLAVALQHDMERDKYFLAQAVHHLLELHAGGRLHEAASPLQGLSPEGRAEMRSVAAGFQELSELLSKSRDD